MKNATLVLAASLFVLSGCGGGGSGGGFGVPPPTTSTPTTSPPTATTPEPESAGATKVTFYPETENPMLLGFTLKDGTVATLLGVKNADGTLQRPKGMMLQAPNTDVSTRMEHDDAGRITKASIAGVGVLRFDWSDNQQASVSATLDSGYVVTSSVKVDGGLAVSSKVGAEKASASSLQAPAEAMSTLRITVKSDAPETGASVFADVLTKSALVPTRYPLDEVGAGVYETTIVNTPSVIAIENFEKGCESLVTGYLRVCRPLGQAAVVMAAGGCAALGFAAAALAGPEMLLLVAPCEAAFVNLSAACAVAQAVPSTGIPGAPNPASPLVCKGISSVISLYDPDGSDVTAKANKGGRYGETAFSVPGRAPIAAAEIELVPEFQTFSGTLVANGPAFINAPQATPPFTCSGSVSEQLDITVKVKSVGTEPPIGTVTGHRGQSNTQPCGYNDFMNVSPNWNLGLKGPSPGLSSAHFVTPFAWGTSTFDFQVATTQEAKTKKYSVQAEVSFRDDHSDGSVFSGRSGPVSLAGAAPAGP